MPLSSEPEDVAFFKDHDTQNSLVFDAGIKSNDPEKAARSVQLAQATDIPADQIFSNPELYDNQTKTFLAEQLRKNSKPIQQYIDSDPMATHVSSDDWSQIWSFGRALNRVFGDEPMIDRSKVAGRSLVGNLLGIEPYMPTPKSIGEDVSAGLHTLTGGLYAIGTAIPKAAGLMELEPVTQEILANLEEKMKEAQWDPYVRKSAMFLLRRQAAGAEALYGASPLILTKMLQIPKLLLIPGLTVGGVISQEISKPIEKETGIPSWATDLAMMVGGTALGFKTLKDLRAAEGTKIQRTLNAARQSDPFFELEKTPPFGFNEVTDHLHTKAAEREASLIKEAVDASDKTATKERAPDLAVKFARTITGDKTIEINADAVNRLYEGKFDEKYGPEDGLLGWIPNLREQLAQSAKDGGPIRVRADEYFGRGSKDTHKFLQDDIRRDPDGITKNQAKEYKPTEEPLRAEIRQEEGAWTVYVDGVRDKGFITRSAAEEHLVRVAPEQSFEGGLRKAAGIDQVEYDLAAGDVVDIAPSPIADRLVFKLPKAAMDRLLRLREKVEKARQDREFNKAEGRVRKERTPEWQDRFDEQLAQTAIDLNDNPQYMIKRLFDDRMVGNQGLDEHVRIDRASLTPEEQKIVPRNWMAKKDGFSANDIANKVLGLEGGKKELIDHIANLEGSRGKTSRTDYFNRLLAQEARERMHRKYGDPAEAIYDEAMDHVTDDSTFGQVWEHLLASAMKAEKPWTMDKEDFRLTVLEDMRGRPFTRRVMEDAHREMGKAHKDSVVAATKKDWNELLIQQQRYAYNHVLAQEGRRLNARIKESDRLDKRLGRGKVIEGLATEHTDRLHDIMMRTGSDVRRGPGAMKDLGDALTRHNDTRKGKGGFSEGLRGFWEEHIDRGMPVEDNQYENDSMPNMVVYKELFDPSWVKLPENMTIGEWEAIADTKKSIAKWGSKVFYEDKAGKRIAHEDVIAGIVKDLEFFEEKPVKYDKLGIAKDAKPSNLRLMWTALRQLEPIVYRIGRFDPNAPFIRAFHKLVDAANHSRVLETEYGRRLNQIAELVSKFTEGNKMTDVIHNDVLYEPRNLIKDEHGKYLVPPAGSPYRVVTVQNLTTMMLNMGLKSGQKRMADGYGTTPQVLMDYINHHATNEHWAYVKGIWKLFRDIKDAENVRDIRMQGVTIPEEIGVPLETPFGRFRGEYYPVIHDRGDPFFDLQSDAYKYRNQRVRLADGWEKERTTHDGPLSLNIADLNGHLARRIKALGMKEAVVEFGNIIYDRNFQQAFVKRFGKTTMDMWEPFLRDVAGKPGWESPTVQGFGKWFDGVRRGTVQGVAGTSIKIIGKHVPTAVIHAIGDVGAWRFMEAITHVAINNKMTMNQNNDFIYGKTMIAGREHNGSYEIQGRSHHWYEVGMGGIESIMSKPPSAFEARKYGLPTNMSVWKVIKNELIERGAYAIQTADMKIAEATYLAKYSHVMEELTPTGMDPWEMHLEAHRLGEFSVRSALGSTATTGRSAMFRQAAWYYRGLTAFMGFFNSTQARLETAIFRSKDAFREYSQTGDGKAFLQEQKAAGRILLHYFVLTAAVEQIVEGFFHEDTDPPLYKWGFKPFLHLGSQMFPAARSVYSALEYGAGFNPGMTIVDTGMDKIEKLAQSLNDPRKFRTPKGQIQLVGNVLDVLAATRSIGNFTTSKIAQAMLNISYGGEIPNDVQDFFNLWTRGTVRGPRHRRKRNWLSELGG